MKWGRILLAILILCSLCFFFGYRKGRKGANSGFKTKTDTLVIYKTQYGLLPEYKTEEFVRWAFFTDAVTDTITETEFVHDTIYVPITQKYYEELDGRLRMWVSGYQPNLDKWELDEQTKVVTKYRKWNFGIGAGAGVIYTPFTSSHIDAGIGIFGGVTYNF